MRDIKSFIDSLKIRYQMYEETVEEPYKKLNYEEWLEMECLRYNYHLIKAKSHRLEEE